MNEIWGVLRGNSIINNHKRAWLLLIVDMLDLKKREIEILGFMRFGALFYANPRPIRSVFIFLSLRMWIRDLALLLTVGFTTPLFFDGLDSSPPSPQTFPVSLDFGCWVGV